ncbi:hypothetical protein [Novosphingobium acidiphilum]|uniref:hypothetical protein n=1 Tax=Novosphingobium acidiphilum TaxID=505248 RepID=UPI0012EB0C89|nr:hypothetical protein [Novosphingobium acidiphilum]
MTSDDGNKPLVDTRMGLWRHFAIMGRSAAYDPAHAVIGIGLALTVHCLANQLCDSSKERPTVDKKMTKSGSEPRLEAQPENARVGQCAARATIAIDETLRRYDHVEDVADKDECAKMVALPAQFGVDQRARANVAAGPDRRLVDDILENPLRW